MNIHFKNIILESTGATDLCEIEMIQSLWSGYGKILRYELQGSKVRSVVVKHVCVPNQGKHPRGWNTDLSHQRKLKSYQVETAWYKQWSSYCDNSCRVPKCFALESHKDEVLMVLEDLDASGYSERRASVSWAEMKGCLEWLANFHAIFMSKKPENLWKIGTYWHLDTRPDELEELSDIKLKRAASAIDNELNNSPFQTFVHGDAKLANFCFSPDGKNISAVDFQYVGGGCGMKDIAYFTGSCLDEYNCERLIPEILDFYFEKLKKALQVKQKSIDTNSLEENWRMLYPVAWADFHRFLKGWSPGHWKLNTYSEQISREVINQLKERNN
ncbi:DUF1679 domain-containing protein [bacterium]|nr:DUF1679 domain-containing protein [bacterium]